MASREYIVVSDTHFSPRSSPEDIGRFCSFLDGLAAPRPDGESLTLVVAGDLFNLDIVEYRRGAREPAPPQQRLAAILERFPRLAESLARLVGAGHGIMLLAGNHDIELFHPEAMRTLRGCVLRHIPGGEGAGTGVIDFSNPGRLWIGRRIHVEHGNRFDGDNRFDEESYRLVARGLSPLLPLGSCLERRLLSRIPQLNYHGFSVNTPWPLFRTVLSRHGLVGGFDIIFRYFSTAFGLMIESFKRRADLGRGAGQGPEAPDTLSSPLRTFLRLYLDRSLAFAGLVLWILLTPLLILKAPSAWLMGCALFLVFFAFAFREGNRYRESISQACRRGAGEVLAADGARTVILGHTHEPEVSRPRGNGSVYLNAGSFEMPTRDGCPYIRILERDGDHEASLEYFNQRMT